LHTEAIRLAARNATAKGKGQIDSMPSAADRDSNGCLLEDTAHRQQQSRGLGLHSVSKAVHMIDCESGEDYE